MAENNGRGKVSPVQLLLRAIELLLRISWVLILLPDVVAVIGTSRDPRGTGPLEVKGLKPGFRQRRLDTEHKVHCPVRD